ncbi:transglycosylase domain-containing protein, partial [Micromonosporaceae bacterium B7E4]
MGRAGVARLRFRIGRLGFPRAAWNNFTGGSKQGASTITQQYARNAYENLQDDSY